MLHNCNVKRQKLAQDFNPFVEQKRNRITPDEIDVLKGAFSSVFDTAKG